MVASFVWRPNTNKRQAKAFYSSVTNQSSCFGSSEIYLPRDNIHKSIVKGVKALKAR